MSDMKLCTRNIKKFSHFFFYFFLILFILFFQTKYSTMICSRCIWRPTTLDNDCDEYLALYHDTIHFWHNCHHFALLCLAGMCAVVYGTHHQLTHGNNFMKNRKKYYVILIIKMSHNTNLVGDWQKIIYSRQAF